MNHRILLNLAMIPTLAGSMLAIVLMPALAHPAGTRTPTSVQTSCSVTVDSGMSFSETRLAFQNGETNDASSTESLNEDPMMDFSGADSDAAVALFGCDCPPCINALRQLQSQLSSQVLLSSRQILASNSQGHCWTALQERTSPIEVQDILQDLEAKEVNQ